MMIGMIAALAGAAAVAWAVYWCTEPPPTRRYCVFCKTTSIWRPEMGCELCHEADAG